MSVMEIAILSPYCYPLFNDKVEGSFGGAEVDLYIIAKYLATRKDVNVRFYIGDYGQGDIEVYEGVQLEKIKYFGWHDKTLSQKAVGYFDLFSKLLRSPSSIIMTEMANDWAGWATIFFKVLRKKHHIHRLASDKDTNHLSRESFGGRVHDFLYSLGIRHGDLIISQTDRQKHDLMNYYGRESLVIGNGAFINDHLQFDDKSYVLWVARCVPIKRPELFIDLAEAIPNKNFVMVMPIDEQAIDGDYSKEIKLRLAKAMDLSNFTYIPYVPYKQVQSYYDQASLFINTSVYEGFPNAFIQACLGGTPIGSIRVNPDDFLDQYGLGKSFDGDYEKLRSFVEKFDTEQLRDYGSKALAYGHKHHNIEVIGSEYYKLIASLINEEA